MVMKLYNLNEITQHDITNTQQERAHYNMLQALINPELLINNVTTDMKTTIINNNVLPVTINNQAYNTSYVCSIYTAFVPYAKLELKKIPIKIVRFLLACVINTFDRILKKARIDQVVSNNNFLLSTNLYPHNNWDTQVLLSYIQTLITKYPEHVIIFRSLNTHTNKTLIEALKNTGCQLIPSRQVYIFDRTLKDYKIHHNYQIDLNLLKKQKIHNLCFNNDITNHDYERIAYLYKKLYIDKYSIYNPLFNRAYIEQSHKNNFIEYFGLRNADGILDGIIGCYDRDKTTTAPIVGYDTDLPQNSGLYRILIAYCINRAEEKNMILNLSSGASHFKLLRGGIPFVEYSAVYKHHIKNRFQKSTWGILGFLVKNLGIPIMKFFKL